MSVTADQLGKSAAQGRGLDAIVREQILIIDDQLLKSDKTWGRNVVAYDLPANYAFPGLQKQDAQRIIYSMIIRNLQDRGFKVRIYLEPDRTTLYVEWVTGLGQKDVDAMNRVIKEARIATPEQLDAYLGGAAGDPSPAEKAAPP